MLRTFQMPLVLLYVLLFFTDAIFSAMQEIILSMGEIDFYLSGH